MDTSQLWADTSVTGTAVVPPGGAQGTYLIKNSASDYDTGWSAPGLTLLASSNTTGTVFNFDNVFSGTYQNYIIHVVPITNPTGTNAITFVFRSGGVSKRVSYWTSTIQVAGTSVTGTSTIADTSLNIGGSTSTGGIFASHIDIYNPYTSSALGKMYKSRRHHTSSGTNTSAIASGYMNTSDICDGFAIECTLSTQVSIRVFGYG